MIHSGKTRLNFNLWSDSKQPLMYPYWHSEVLFSYFRSRPAVEWHQGTRFRSLEPGMWSRLSVCRIDIKHACVARHGIWSTSRGWGSDGGFGGGAVAEKWRLWLCLRSGIGFRSGGLRYQPWGSSVGRV